MSLGFMPTANPEGAAGAVRLACLRLAASSVRGTAAQVLAAAMIFERYIETGALPSEGSE